jgi:hypothetical protein
MKVRAMVSLLGLLFAIVVIPSQLFADSFCQTDQSIYQYQPCGTVATSVLFRVDGQGQERGVTLDFQGYHADFGSSIQALVYRNGQLIYTGSFSPTNLQMQQYDTFTLVPAGVAHAGDDVELVQKVDDINGEQYFYSENLGKNSDGLNHTWGMHLGASMCDPNGHADCVFVGFEDLPKQEGADFDYNDFKMWLYGVQVTEVPEPSSLILITGAPLAFALGKLRRFF